MIKTIVLTAIPTAIVTLLWTVNWSAKVRGRGDATLAIAATFLIKDLEVMARELGYGDVYQYWLATRGKDYADNGLQNINNTLNFIKNR